MEGVLATEHKGAALQTLIIDNPNGRVRRQGEPEIHGHVASMAFMDLLARGVYPNLVALAVHNYWGEFLYGDYMLALFITNIRDASCTKTLHYRTLSLHVLNPGIILGLRLRFPRVKMLNHTSARYLSGHWRCNNKD